MLAHFAFALLAIGVACVQTTGEPIGYAACGVGLMLLLIRLAWLLG